MGKPLYIAEKPSVAMEFARCLGIKGDRKDGYLEGDDGIVTWCVGHLVQMSYPEAYDPNLKKWSMNTIPFFPETWKYEIIDSVKKQFGIVSRLLNRSDVDTIYVCTDSGREGEYIYRLVRQEANVKKKSEKRVWIDSQTEEEIRRGVREAKDLSEYDHLASAAYLRAKEDYLMGINFSRALTLKFGQVLSKALHQDRGTVVSVGRVMTCVLGLVVSREREIRSFVPTPFYRVLGSFEAAEFPMTGEWKADETSRYYLSPKLYKENGFKKEEDAKHLIEELKATDPYVAVVRKNEKKTESKNPPLFFNLAELQNECSKKLKISPDETLKLTQSLYEKKLVTYPRTDARVLSSAVAKEIGKNLSGLKSLDTYQPFLAFISEHGEFGRVKRRPYTNDAEITDHYAIIPTGQTGAVRSLSEIEGRVYDLIVRRFLAAFYPKKVTEKCQTEVTVGTEPFFMSFRYLKEEGFLKVLQDKKESSKMDETQESVLTEEAFRKLSALKPGDTLSIKGFSVKEGTTEPPKRYTSGSLILAMENAGQLIEDESLREEIRGSGIGTSATRAEILKKLTVIDYLKIRQKTQVVVPSVKGELIYDTVSRSIPKLLSPELTASWEKGLSYVAKGTVEEAEYMEKLTSFVRLRTEGVKAIQKPEAIRPLYDATLQSIKSVKPA